MHIPSCTVPKLNFVSQTQGIKLTKQITSKLLFDESTGEGSTPAINCLFGSGETLLFLPGVVSQPGYSSTSRLRGRIVFRRPGKGLKERAVRRRASICPNARLRKYGVRIAGMISGRMTVSAAVRNSSSGIKTSSPRLPLSK